MQEQEMQSMAGEAGLWGLGADAAQALGVGLAIVAVTLLLVLAFLSGRATGRRTALATVGALSLVFLAAGLYLFLTAPSDSMAGAMGESVAMAEAGPDGMVSQMPATGMTTPPPAADGTPSTSGPVQTPTLGTMQAEGVSAEAMAAFTDRELYQVYCYNCHGERGMGDGSLAGVIAVRPANIQEHLTHHPEDELIALVIQGIPPAMPAMPFGETEAARIIDYLRSVAPDAPMGGVAPMDHSEH